MIFTRACIDGSSFPRGGAKQGCARTRIDMARTLAGIAPGTPPTTRSSTIEPAQRRHYTKASSMIDTTAGTANPRVTFCSAVSEASGEDPAGSAWAVRRMAVVELPLPWPYSFLEGRNMPKGLGDLLMEIWEADGAATGIIGIAPDAEYSVEGMRRVIDLRQGDAVAGPYERVEYLVPADELVEFLRRLAFEPDHPAVTARGVDVDPATRDLLICTHGAVDACCATYGYPMYKLMRAMTSQAQSPVRVWRATHFGGHRFAATAFDAPEGRYWGRLKADMLSSFIHRSGPARDLRDGYRGWGALADPRAQIAEAELLATAGWGWTDATITRIDGEATEAEGGSLAVAFTHPAGDGEVDITITPNGTVTTMDSSKSGELHDAPQYTVRIVAERPEGCLAALDGFDAGR
jgi:hypothetical protein